MCPSSRLRAVSPFKRAGERLREVDAILVLVRLEAAVGRVQDEGDEGATLEELTVVEPPWREMAAAVERHRRRHEVEVVKRGGETDVVVGREGLVVNLLRVHLRPFTHHERPAHVTHVHRNVQLRSVQNVAAVGERARCGQARGGEIGEGNGEGRDGP